MTLDEILKEINKAEKIVILTHESPDGDAIGSCLAMKLMLKELSYEIDILEGKLNSISIEKVLDSIGFPTNYKEIARMP